jgi:hypothetical protein
VPAAASIDDDGVSVNNTRLSTDDNEVPSYEESLLDDIRSNYSTANMVYEPDTGLPLVDSELRWSRLDAIRVVLSLSVSILIVIQLIRHASEGIAQASLYLFELLLWVS